MEKNRISILWLNDNAYVSHAMVFLYATNSKINSWWEEVDIILWGPPAKLVVENPDIQEKLKMVQQVGVKVRACISCASQFGVVDDLRALGIEVEPMGEHLTELLKNDEKLLTI